ncbi:DUF4350 domain-containing protein [Geofilum sp. OHC36d9]|uniref:DUF4350 domain-containing protein n=1 Tax=Geofilum sp. OHC36d9 TaxID=3458413 RepID=UPI004033D7AF
MKKLLVIVFLTGISFLGFGQKNILLDNYYNNEISGKTGNPYHYLWEDTDLSGFSQFGKLFTDKGCRLSLLGSKPSRRTLKDASVYIIVDPDTRNETEDPKFMDDKAAKQIVAWVRRGGVLLVLANDSKNCELDKLNLLMSKFGMHFNDDILHQEKSQHGKPRNFNSCASTDLPDHVLFKDVTKIFIKGLSSITCSQPAVPILEENGAVIIAEARLGKGKVIAVGDPWLYNEYIDHLFLPSDFDNYQAAKNLVDLLLDGSDVK